jgi:hypothetical protein
MNLRSFILLAGTSLSLHAAVLAPERLLPADTLGVVTIPDYLKAQSAYEQEAMSLLWGDAAMKPFKDKLMKKVKEEWLTPLENQLGVKFSDYSGLAQGQITFAVVQNGWQGRDQPAPAWLVLIDTRERSGQLRTNLADLKKKWTDASRKSRTERIRDVEFTTLMVSGDEIGKTIEKAVSEPKQAKTDKAENKSEEKEKQPGSKKEIIIGQSESLLIAGNDAKVIEKILARQAGGAVPALGEQSAFEADHQARLRNALVYGWVHFKPIADVLNRLAAEESAKSNNSDSPDPTKLMTATGLGGLRTVLFTLNETADGSFIEFHLGVPAAVRSGIFKLIAADSRDAGPPPFVPGGAVKFQRWRLDVQKAWAALENMLVEISPQAGGVFKLMFENAGKDKDPNFDMRRELIGNLGDDIIGYERSPRGNTLTELNSPPSLYLIGSPNADKLAVALKMITSLLPAPLNTVKEREFLGRKIYSLNMGPTVNPDGSTGSDRKLSYAASGGYVALSTDDAILETYLRSSEASGKALRETAGLAEAAQKVGGMNTGLFGYENSSETMRVTLETLKKDSEGLERILGLTPLGARLNANGAHGLKDWVDFSLLPAFESIAKYFHFTVYAGSANADGLSYKVFSPTPPQLKK